MTMTISILLGLYWIANCIVLGLAGNIVGNIDELTDVKVWHIIIAILFLPATIILFLIGVIGVGCMEFASFWRRKKPLKFLYKPVFKKREQKKEELSR